MSDSREIFPGIFVKGDLDDELRNLLDDRWFAGTAEVFWKKLQIGFLLRKYTDGTCVLTSFKDMPQKGIIMFFPAGISYLQSLELIFSTPSWAVQRLKEIFKHGTTLYFEKYNGNISNVVDISNVADIPSFSTPTELEMKLALKGIFLGKE